MRKLLIGLALLALPCVAWGANHYEPSHLLSTAWGETAEMQFQNVTLGYVTGDTLYSRADTLGPVFVGKCRAVLAAASWTGDSTTVTVQSSVDRSHWSAVSLSNVANLGTASTYGLYFSRILEPTTANVTASVGGSIAGTQNLGYGHWLRVIITNNNVYGARITGLAARVSCIGR